MARPWWKSKCPISVCDSKPSATNLLYLEEENGETFLKKNHAYYFQIQGQMAITQIHRCIFFVFTHYGYFMQNIDFDMELWKLILLKLNFFWFKYILPEIINENLKNVNDKAEKSAESGSSEVAVFKAKQSTSKFDISLECAKCFEPLIDVPKKPS